MAYNRRYYVQYRQNGAFYTTWYNTLDKAIEFAKKHAEYNARVVDYFTYTEIKF